MHKEKEENGMLSHLHHHDAYRSRELSTFEHGLMDGDMFIQVSAGHQFFSKKSLDARRRLDFRKRRFDSNPPLNWNVHFKLMIRIAQTMTCDSISNRHSISWVNFGRATENDNNAFMSATINERLNALTVAHKSFYYHLLNSHFESHHQFRGVS